MVRFLKKILNKVVGEETLEDTILESTKKEVETQTTLLQKKAEPFTGVPAPVYLKDDEWFGPAPISDLNQDYVVQEAEIKQQEQENRQYWTNESEDIHQVMYEMATKNAATTLQLDPIGGSENFQGGSENVHR